ncbi:SNX14 isoform 8 [Pan troglodytes]|uniref:Sorting nexin 14 n=5 Tax=Hominidae TaxID=9604 RepID=D6RDH9_HUMAN|nr:sorting nexin 14 [Homo sapiens]KAI4019059.1 sorting nexin 14 [Homo sapiens]PNI88003.1 SNX14 isoform 8 [Pan troglodytes]PNJ51802.1 SNX14 isoform 3 [Pongo abelii]
MVPWVRTMGQKLKQRLRLDVGREICRQYPLFCFLLLCLSAASLLLNRYIHILMIFWSFVAGVVTFYCSLGPDSLLPNIFFTIKYKPKQLGLQELFPQGHSCAVCGKVKCKRHRPSLLLENYQPWLDLKISSKVDASLSEVLELVLENFVYPWYRDVTDDESFVDELRITLRFFASVLIRRIHKVDIPSIITKKLLKAAMKHIEVIVKARQKVKNTEFLQQAALEEYGPELHVALRSRRDELHYLRKLTELLFPYILPPKATDCRSLTLLIREILSGSVFLPSLDFLADPDTVNHLLIIFIDDSPPEKATEPASPLVPFLQKFAEPRNKKPSVLKLELKQIREQQDLLFRFMNFLKQEGAVHVLQFCLTVEEFNDRILRPELSNDEMLSLHEELQKIYKTYCLDESIDKIRFDPFIVEEIQRRKIIKSVPGKLMKEKGQHLEPFIMNFINSCESPKPKPSRPELTILSPTSENNKKLFNDLFKNNANRAENTERKQNQNYFMEVMTVEGVYDYLMYVGRVVFQVPDWLHHLLMGTRILFKNTLEMYTDYYLQCKLEQLFQEHRLVSLITLLRDAIFCENTEPRSLQDKQKGAKQTFEEMMNYIPDLLVKCIGEETKYESIRLLFDGLQQPVLNKQLTYVLLDIVIQELFPELNKVQKEVTSVTSWM